MKQTYLKVQKIMGKNQQTPLTWQKLPCDLLERRQILLKI